MKKIIIIFFIVFLCVVLLFWLLIGRYDNAKKPTQVPSPTPPSFSYRGIAPGVSKENDVIASLGEPLRKDEGSGGGTLVYSSGLGDQPVNVDISKDGVVYRIYEPTSSSLRYNKLIDGLGAPGLVLYGLFEIEGFRLFVFLDRGVAFVANPQTQEVRERWYFPPTDAYTFRRIIAPNMSLKSTAGQQ